jgi:hypothetical protein
MVLVSGDALRCQRARFMTPLALSHTQLAGGSKSPKAVQATGQQRGFYLLLFG